MWRRHKCNLLTSSHYLLQQAGSRDQCYINKGWIIYTWTNRKADMTCICSLEKFHHKDLHYTSHYGTSLLRQTLLPHCEQVTIHGVTFRMPSWASLRDLVELFPLGGLCPLADKLL
ncbi:uncharacterized protein [Porites lutea]|uniref:uncharacterized protein n=1 Tax=Porites lutea TaxID=51062 RepID=UPI003CC5037D